MKKLIALLMWSAPALAQEHIGTFIANQRVEPMNLRNGTPVDNVTITQASHSGRDGHYLGFVFIKHENGLDILRCHVPHDLGCASLINEDRTHIPNDQWVKAELEKVRSEFSEARAEAFDSALTERIKKTETAKELVQAIIANPEAMKLLSKAIKETN